MVARPLNFTRVILLNNESTYTNPVNKIAIISVHGCPQALLGGKSAGGMNVYVSQIASSLGRKDIEVDVFTRSHTSCANRINEVADNVRVIHIDAGSIDDEKDTIKDTLNEFENNAIDFVNKEGTRYDLIHSQYWFSGKVGAHLAERWAIPHIVTFHTLSENKIKARIGELEPEERFYAEREIAKTADRIIGFSEHEKSILINSYEAPVDRVAIIPCGVDIDLFKPYADYSAKEQLGLENMTVLLYVGRLEPLKGIDILLKAASIMDHSENLKVLIIGGDDDQDQELCRLKTLVKELNISDKVIFLGRIEQDALPTYYNAADICVVPSFYESFGLVALEAMACGTPVVASRVGGLTSIVKNNITGLLIPWRFPETFADGIDSMLANKTNRQYMSDQSRTLALSLSWDSVTHKLIETYNSTCRITKSE